MQNFSFRPSISRKEAKALTKALDHALGTLRLSEEEQTLITRFLNKINEREWLATYLEKKTEEVVQSEWQRIKDQSTNPPTN